MPVANSAYRGQNIASTHLRWDVFVTPSIPVVTTDFAPGEHERPWPPISERRSKPHLSLRRPSFKNRQRLGVRWWRGNRA